MSVVVAGEHAGEVVVDVVDESRIDNQLQDSKVEPLDGIESGGIVVKDGPVPVEIEGAEGKADSMQETSAVALALQWFDWYKNKFTGVPGKKAPDMTKPMEMVFSSCLAFIGLFLVSLTDYYYLQEEFHVDNLGIKMLTGAYAASSVLLYEAYQSPLAQPRNVIGSYIIASIVGVTVRITCDAIGLHRYVTGPMAVFFALFFMNATKTVHPPGGACALIAVIGGKMVEKMGYGYVLTSFGAAFIMTAVAVLGNNLIPTRQYPLYWY